MKTENIFVTAKRIRRKNESWQDAIQRAKKQRLSGFSDTMKKAYTKTKEVVGDALANRRYNNALNVLEEEERKNCYSRRERNNIKDVRRLIAKRKCAE